MILPVAGINCRGTVRLTRPPAAAYRCPTLSPLAPATESSARVYWTAFIGLFFDYYDLFLFIYLEKVLAGHFGLSDSASSASIT